MATNITYIGEKPAANHHAGNKARVDVDTVLREKYGEPYENLEEIIFTGFSQKAGYVLNLSNLKQIRRLMQLHAKNVIMQYPFYFNPIVKKVLRDSLHKNDVVFLIHDINALRSFQDAEIKTEIDELNMAKAVIVHNDIMGRALQELGMKTPWISLGLFDYLLPSLPQNTFEKGNTIVFAGNLGKSIFLRHPELQQLDVRFNLYGPGYKKELINGKNVTYKGSFAPDEIPFKLEGNFGLIWDGEDVTTCDGPTGVYMQYNNPHKLSLYIAAGIPVIVWEKAAIARFVKAKGIGFSVLSLKDISKKIDGITKTQYYDMVKNLKTLQSLVTKGHFTKQCLKKMEAYFQ